MFDQLLESSSAQKKESRSRGFLVSLLVHGVVLGLMLALPVILYKGLPGAELVAFLAAPPRLQVDPLPQPTATPPTQDEPRESQPIRIPDPRAFVAPTIVPEEVPPPDEELEFSLEYWVSPAPDDGRPSGVPGGLGIGGQGVPGQIIPTSPGLPPLPPPRDKRVEPIRQGGKVMASRLIKRVDPVYPPLARRARIEGLVLLKILVDEQGNVSKAEVFRGNPLLDRAALEAVRKWKYSPTLLNGEPVPVIATVSVHFRLNR